MQDGPSGIIMLPPQDDDQQEACSEMCCCHCCITSRNYEEKLGDLRWSRRHISDVSVSYIVCSVCAKNATHNSLVIHMASIH